MNKKNKKKCKNERREKYDCIYTKLYCRALHDSANF